MPKLSDPITDEELKRVNCAIRFASQLGLYRFGEGEESFCAVSLLEKLVAEYEVLRAESNGRR